MDCSNDKNTNTQNNGNSQLDIGHGFLSVFFYRYLAGGTTLDELRGISRRNLALSQVIEAPEYAHATLLKKQIEQFEKAVCLIKQSESISIELLCQMNSILTPEHESSGIIRPVQNWIGTSREKPAYLPPPPSELASLLNNFVDIINYSSLTPNERAIAAYVYLIRIHPFADGNGRTSRALYAGILSKTGKAHIPLSLYRLKAPPKRYFDFIKSPKINSKRPITHSYLDEAHQWINNYEKEVSQRLIKTQQIISTKIGFSYMTKEDMDIVTLMWRYPILTYSKIESHLNKSSNATGDIISKLVNCSLLAIRKISHKSKTIYVAEDILTCWDELDKSIKTVK